MENNTAEKPPPSIYANFGVSASPTKKSVRPVRATHVLICATGGPYKGFIKYAQDFARIEYNLMGVFCTHKM